MRRLAIVALVGLALGLAACGSDGEHTEIQVFAASSLADAFKEAGTAFEDANPGTKVTFNFGASSALAVQINEGAPADVFASADLTQMQALVDRGNAEAPRTFARNLPVVVVPDASVLTTFDELATPGLRLVLAAEAVPIGRYARQVLEKASGADGIAPDFADQVLENLRSEETNVRAVLTKVQLGEADAGIVYQTDIPAGGSVRSIEIPSEFNVVALYPIAVVSGSGESEAAGAFVDFILGEEGRAILRSHGFAGP